MLSWTITEAVNELEHLCSGLNVADGSGFSLEARYKQYLVTQLLHRRLFPESELSYEPTGKPVVSNGRHISISHSGDIVVMMESAAACGTDIEKIHPRVEKVKRKFLSDDELHLYAGASTEELTRLWTAKEAMFKVHGSDTVFMRSNIFVQLISPELAHARLWDGSLEIQRNIRFHINGDMILAWTEPADEA